MAADAILDFHINLNNSGSINPIVIKFYSKLRLGTPDMILGSKMKFFKIQLAADAQLKFTYIAITSKRLVRNEPNLKE